ncbi:MAG: hypothetical protein GY869_12040 [Planctomycetes bacterium]|nr:hypothetical protein [Planctomycetota bacterium]
MILDEPAAGLDPMARSQLLDLLMQLIQDESRAIIISSHILSDVEKVIDQAVIMKAGKIVHDGGFDELQEKYCRVRLISLNGELPAELPFEEVLACKREKQEAVVTLRNIAREVLQEKAQSIHCDIEMLPLSLEELYKIVVSEKKGDER